MKLVIGNVKSRAILGGNDLVLKLDKELKKYLRVRRDGYDRSQAYREHRWDGYTSLVTSKWEFATGFVPNVLNLAKSLGCSITIGDERINLPTFVKEPVLGIGNDEGWELRDYQLEAVQAVNNFIDVEGVKLYFPRGILDAATNAGKTSIIAGLLNNLEEFNCLYLVDRQVNFTGTYHFFNQLYDVGIICSTALARECGKTGKENYQPTSEFTLAMIGTIKGHLPKANFLKYMNKKTVVIVDEAHRGASDTYIKVLRKINAGMRIFMSGTSMDIKSKYKKLMLVAQSGTKLATIENKELIDKGVSLPPIVNIYLNDSHVFAQEYHSNYKSNLVYSDPRMVTVIEDLKKDSDGVVVVVKFLEHGQLYYDAICQVLGAENVEFIHGSDKQRFEKIQDFKDKKFPVIVSTSVLQESANVPRIRKIWFLAGGKDVVAIKQWYGRSAREDGENDHVVFNDFFDGYDVLAKHSRIRIKALKKQGFDINFHYECNAHFTPTK